MKFLDKFKYCPSCGSSHFEENDFKSKHCADCGFTYFFNAAAAVVSIIANERGELLVCRRACEPAKGTLDLVGGFVDPSGETLEEGMIREIKEEIGLDINTKQLKYLFSFPNTYLFSDLTVHTIDAFFYVEIDSSSVLTPHDDVAECCWIHPENLNPADIGLDSIRNGVVKYLGVE